MIRADDPDTGFYFPASGTLAISTNGTGRLFVDASGNVGVGISAPSNNLDIAGAGTAGIRARTTDTSGSAVGRLIAAYEGGGGGSYSNVELRAGNGYSYLVNTTNNAMLFGTNSTERMRLDTSGRLGLGTSSPTALLDVRGNALFNAEDAFWGFDAATSPRLGFVKKSGSPPIIGVGSATAFSIAHSSGTDINTPSSQTYTTRFHITSGGNVGIGTTSPTKKLQVEDTSATSTSTFANVIARFVSAASNGDSNIQFSNGVNSSANIGIAGGANLYFGLDGVERMRIDSSGRVGIGTTTPNGRLDVVGGTIEFDPGSGADSTRAFNFNIGAVNFAKLLVPTGSGGALAIHTGGIGAVSERARIDSSGRLLVGTSANSGGARIQASGSVQASLAFRVPANNRNGGTCKPIAIETISTDGGSNTATTYGNSRYGTGKWVLLAAFNPSGDAVSATTSVGDGSTFVFCITDAASNFPTS
jgi:hypothetical protein